MSKSIQLQRGNAHSQTPVRRQVEVADMQEKASVAQRCRTLIHQLSQLGLDPISDARFSQSQGANVLARFGLQLDANAKLKSVRCANRVIWRWSWQIEYNGGKAAFPSGANREVVRPSRHGRMPVGEVTEPQFDEKSKKRRGFSCR